jgi:hypothetical protein
MRNPTLRRGTNAVEGVALRVGIHRPLLKERNADVFAHHMASLIAALWDIRTPKKE